MARAGDHERPLISDSDRDPLVELRICCECDWVVRADEDDIAAVSRLVVDHAVETGHDIETRFVEAPSIDEPTGTAGPRYGDSPTGDRRTIDTD